MVVGHPEADVQNFDSENSILRTVNVGSVDIITRNRLPTRSVWKIQGELKRPDVSGNQVRGRFGESIDIDGDYIVVYSLEEKEVWPGAVYVFRNTGGATWESVYKIDASADDSNSNLSFDDVIKTNVAISGKKIAVGLAKTDGPNNESNTGKVDVFRQEFNHLIDQL